MAAPVVTVRMQHVRAAGMCAAGARAFFVRHGLSWGDFLKNGVSSDVLEQTGDAMALQVVEVARGQR